MTASLICAWCKRTIRQGDPAEDPSHGCCPDCYRAILGLEDPAAHVDRPVSVTHPWGILIAMLISIGILGWVFYTITKG